MKKLGFDIVDVIAFAAFVLGFFPPFFLVWRFTLLLAQLLGVA